MRSPARVLLAAVTAAATLTTVVACAPPSSEDVKTTLTVPVSLLVANWDPIQGGLDEEFTYHMVYDFLTIVDVDNRTFTPALAREFVLSDDRQKMTFTLRDDVDFTDGTHLDAAGVEKFYDALVDSDLYVYGGLTDPYDVEFTAIGEYTLEMTTSRPIYGFDFWQLIGQDTPILSPVALDDPELAMAKPLGSGPYVVGEVVPEISMTLVRNPDYWDAEKFPYDEIVFTVMTDPTARLNALKSGQIDAAPLDLSQVAEAEASGLTLSRGSTGFYALYAYDPVNSTLPALRDPRVSQAIALAFDREAIVESLDLGYGIASSQAFLPGQPEYIEDGDDYYGYDPERARSLLAEAGYPDGFEVVIPSHPGMSGIEPIVLSSLADIGISVSFEQFPDVGAWSMAYMGGSYPLILNLIWNPNNLYFFTSSFPGYGRFRAEVPEVLDLIAEIKESEPEASVAASQELGRKLLEEALVIPISRPATFWASAPGVVVKLPRTAGLPTRGGFQRAD